MKDSKLITRFSLSPMPLRIANARTDHIAVDMAGVTPESLARVSLDDVRRTRVQHGNRREALGDLFAIEGKAGDMTWRLDGDFSAVHWLGARMSAGEIVVDGAVGRHAGSQMNGGLLEIRGDAGDWLGAEMRGGAIRVRGDAGDHVGAAFAGSPRGMIGGTILIDGAAGDSLGAGMRRGLIAVAGDVGAQTGARMRAGTILAFGICGAGCGAGMRRGTIGIFGSKPPALGPTFRLAIRAPLPMLRLMEKQLWRVAFAADGRERLREPVALHHGDLLDLGRGEVLVAS